MLRLVASLSLTLALLVTAGASTVAAAGPDPVLLVHGYRGSPSSWADMKAYLEGTGRTVHAIDLPG